MVTRIAALMVAMVLVLPAPALAGMKIFFQWAKSNPGDWVLGDSSNWGTGSKKSDPVGDVNALGVAVGDTLLNNQNGWIAMVNVQGVQFFGADHFAIEDLTGDEAGGITVTAWFDDPIWYPVGAREAWVFKFLPLAFDPGVGQVNTRQSRVIYCENQACIDAWTGGEATVILPFSEFIAPAASVTKHGIWMSDAKLLEHIASQTLHGWREWTQ